MIRLAACAAVILLGSCAEREPETAFRLANDQRTFMTYVVDPAADVVWESAGYDLTIDGERDLSPTTEEGWTAVAHSAAVIAESGDLMLLPGRVVDEELWISQAKAMGEAGLKAMAAARAKDKDALFAAGGEIYTACAACHAQYLPKE